MLTADPDDAARRTAESNGARSVCLQPESDDQATVVISGPAVPVTRWYGTVDQRARTLKAAGDPRTLDQLRFDLATSSYPCAVHPRADGTSPSAQAAGVLVAAGAGQVATGVDVTADQASVAAGLRPSFVEPARSTAGCRVRCRRASPCRWRRRSG